ncbi:hypothetical protein GQ44DRAFT_405014 [Phaeosphaeriaceae sp. PMI808]|nr:hypothetical protein GQ44DRAFT_405014 [Phaeosphaeriaceae sp. PMI808]
MPNQSTPSKMRPHYIFLLQSAQRNLQLGTSLHKVHLHSQSSIVTNTYTWLKILVSTQFLYNLILFPNLQKKIAIRLSTSLPGFAYIPSNRLT